MVVETYSTHPNAMPPYIDFKVKYVKDEDGNSVPKYKAIIKAHGSKDTVVQDVDQVVESFRRDAEDGKCPPHWADQVLQKLELFKKGQDVNSVVEGTHIRMWPAISREEADRLTQLGVYSVEVLAGANEQLLEQIGHGGRALKQRAEEWLKKADVSDLQEQIDKLRSDVEQRDEVIKELRQYLQSLDTESASTNKTTKKKTTKKKQSEE